MNDTRSVVLDALAQVAPANAAVALSDELSLHDALGLTSLDMVRVVTQLCRTLRVNVLGTATSGLANLHTVGDLVALFDHHTAASGRTGGGIP